MLPAMELAPRHRAPAETMPKPASRAVVPAPRHPATGPPEPPSGLEATGEPRARWRRWRAGRVAGLIALAALFVSLARGVQPRGSDRNASLAAELGRRGLTVDQAGVVWLQRPPFSLFRAAVRSAAAVVRAQPGAEEPHDIYLVQAKLSPEGVLLGVDAIFNLTETSAVDEQRPVGDGSRFAFVERAMQADAEASRVRLVDLSAGAPWATRAQPPEEGGSGEPEPTRGDVGLNNLQRVQAAITRFQQTGRFRGVTRWTYTIQPAAEEVELGMDRDALRIAADGRVAEIALVRPRAVPDWLTAERELEAKPGNLVTWAVDRVRAVPWIGDETMQVIKAVAFSALDVVLSSTEAVTGDTGAEDIAADLGQEALSQPTRDVPVDPEIGFPPPPLEPWVTPSLPGEGRWNLKDDDPFIRKLPGLPPAFVTTFIRGDRRRKATRVYVALWDPRQVELHTMAGVAEPKSATGRTGPGLIPREPKVLRRVAAACNAGFQSLHGEYGMMSDGVIYLPPKPYSATVAVLRDGSTAFGTWPNDAVIPDDMLSFRQNMTPMVIDGKYNPYGRTWWGGTPSDWEDKTHTTRTGICLTEEQFVGYFYGSDLSPKALGRAMIQSRCSYGVALDMNAGHSGLEFYHVAPEGELPPLERPLNRDWEREGKVPRMEGWAFRARRLIRGMGLMYFPRYIKREGRDYFYMTLRHILPGLPITVEGEAEALAWQVKGLPQHGFPYALALAEVPLGSGGRARVLKVDPRMVTPRQREARRRQAASAGGDGRTAEDDPKVVVALAPPTMAADEASLSIWSTPDAFAVGSEEPLPGALRLLSGTDARGAADVSAVAGVQEEEGMLVYAQVMATGDSSERPATAPVADLVGLLERLGVVAPVVLAEPVDLALGGDTGLSGAATRLPPGVVPVVLYRKPGPGARRVFPGTPVVPLKEWYPLQSRRIRYFKKKKKEEAE